MGPRYRWAGLWRYSQENAYPGLDISAPSAARTQGFYLREHIAAANLLLQTFSFKYTLRGNGT